MTWSASVAGGARVNWDVAGAGPGLPPALRSVALELAFDAAVDITAGALLSLSVDVTAGVAIGDAGDGNASPVFDLTITAATTYPVVKPIVCAATGSIDLGPVEVRSFEAMLTLFPDPVADGQPEMTITARLEDVTVGEIDMGTVTMAGSVFTKVVTTGGVAATKWYVIGTMVSEVSFDAAASALGIAPSMTADGLAASPLGGSASVGGTVTFNSDTKVISATVSTTYETDYFTVVAAGTFTNVCTDDGMFLSGVLTFTAETPVPLPDIEITATKHCQPWIKEVLTIRAEIDSAAWLDAIGAAAAAAALGKHQRSGKMQPDFSNEAAPGKSPLAALGMATSLSFDVENLVVSLTGSYLEATASDVSELSWVFKIDGAVTLSDTSDSPVPTGVLSVDVAMTWQFAPRGAAMRTKLLARPAALADTCAAAAGASCSSGKVCGAGLACVAGTCVKVAAIADAAARAAAAASAVAAQSYGFGLACAVAGDATGESPSVVIDGTMEIANDDWLTITGSFHAVIPCGAADTASASVRLNLDKSGVKIDATVGMVMYCAAAAAGVKKFRVFGSLDNIEIGAFSMGGVGVDITAYHTSAEVTNGGQYWVGSMSGNISVVEGLDVAVSATFSTKPNAAGLTAAIQATYTRTFSSGTELALFGEVGHGRYCSPRHSA